MKRTELVILSISLGLTILVSTIFGFAGSSLTGSFWSWFWISILGQAILFALVNSVLLQRDRVTTEQLNIKALEQIAKFTIKLSCSYCQQINVVPIQLNTKNTFKCESCNQTNNISMQFIATPLTTPLESVKIPVEGTDSIEFKVTT
jgi:hypothetical protein